MKYKQWELDKEDLEKFASNVFKETIQILIAEGKMDYKTGMDFFKNNSPIILTQDSTHDLQKYNLFGKNNDKNLSLRIIQV
jgi:hypothetical protein